jgi:hypothetical protein
VNEFVEECRTEWKRLGVPDSVANEMAADLAADLEEAEAEGAAPEEVLGSGAFDPRAFAAAWAAERGVIRRPTPNGGRNRKPHVAAAVAVLALILAIIGAALVISAPASAPEKVAVASPFDPPPRAVFMTPRYVTPPRALRSSRPDVRVIPAPILESSARFVPVDTDDSGVDRRAVGSVLLIVGLVGLVPSTLLFLWLAAGRGSARDPLGLNTIQ